MSSKRKFPEFLTFALTGWAGGSVGTIILGLIWPIIFPAIVNVENYYESGPGLLTIILIVLVWSAPAALIGGVIGGRFSVEGGKASQRMFAIVFGLILAIPCASYGLWFFTGR